jgi:hypothetical protein
MAVAVLLFFAVWAGENPDQYIMHSSDPALQRAAEMLNLSRPMAALEILQPAMERHPRDADLLLLAGLAAYRSDQLGAALGYWRRSLDLAPRDRPPNDALNAIYRAANREATTDHSSAKLAGEHINLRYPGGAIPDETARSILATMEQDYSRISAQLGCTSNEPIFAILQPREEYLAATSAATWSGGHFDGRIHISWTAGSERGPRMERALAHELVHACLASIPSGAVPWPVWLQEGLAQKLSGDSLTLSAREKLRRLAAKHGLPRLEDLRADWFCLPSYDAVAAYNLSLAAVEVLYDKHAAGGVRQILATPEVLTSLTTDLDAELGL